MLLHYVAVSLWGPALLHMNISTLVPGVSSSVVDAVLSGVA